MQCPSHSKYVDFHDIVLSRYVSTTLFSMIVQITPRQNEHNICIGHDKLTRTHLGCRGLK